MRVQKIEVPDDVLAVIPDSVSDIAAAFADSTGAPDEILITFFLIKSSIDDNVYGPFLNRDDAMSFAESADGSVLECVARLISAKEI